MKRFAVLLSLFLVAAFVPSAGHAEWVTKEIKWHKSSVGSPFDATGIFVRDTTYNVLAAGQVDTLADFSLDGAVPSPATP